MSSAPPSPSARPPAGKSPRRRRRGRAAVPLAASGTQQMTLRRAPNLWAFVLLGGILGAVVGAVVGVLGAGSAQFTTSAVVLFMVSAFALLGLAAGAVVALVLDRISVARARAVTTEVVDDDAPAPPRADGPPPAGPRA